jgi:hypothetical protein
MFGDREWMESLLKNETRLDRAVLEIRPLSTAYGKTTFERVLVTIARSQPLETGPYSRLPSQIG